MMAMVAVSVILTWASRVTNVTLPDARAGQRTAWVMAHAMLPRATVHATKGGKATPVIFHSVQTTVTTSLLPVNKGPMIRYQDVMTVHIHTLEMPASIGTVLCFSLFRTLVLVSKNLPF